MNSEIKSLINYTITPINNVIILPYALGIEDEKLPFRAPTDRNIGTGTFSIESAEANMVLSVKNGDRLIEEHMLPRMDILKIDTEGWESCVIRGLRKTLIRDRPIILLELSGSERSGFHNFKTFSQFMYPEFTAYGVGTTSINGTYKLNKLNFEQDGEILVVPSEKSHIFDEITFDQAAPRRFPHLK